MLLRPIIHAVILPFPDGTQNLQFSSIKPFEFLVLALKLQPFRPPSLVLLDEPLLDLNRRRRDTGGERARGGCGRTRRTRRAKR